MKSIIKIKIKPYRVKLHIKIKFINKSEKKLK